MSPRPILLWCVCLWAAIASVALRADAAPSQLVNERCPVLPDELAKATHEITFRGVPVRFCCRQCETQFLKDPKPYLASLPHVPTIELSPAKSPQLGIFQRFLSSNLFGKLGQFTDRWRAFLSVMLVIFVCHLLAARWRRRQTADSSSPPRTVVRRVAYAIARPSTLIALVAGMCLIRALQPAPTAVIVNSDAASNVQELTQRFQAELARQGIMQGPEFAAKLEKTYYRGNDDRSPNLFNGGIYCTNAFHVSLLAEDGKTIVAGQQLDVEKSLSIRIEIVRAKNTMASHFEDGDMSHTALVGRGQWFEDPSEGDKSVQYFAVVEPGKSWAAEIPIGRAIQGGTKHLDGVVVICPMVSDGEPASTAWQHAHYGVAYSLRFDNGAISRSSKIWMAALIVTLDLPDEQFHEWLAWEPLPEVSDGFRPPDALERTTQPAELGSGNGDN